MNDIFFEKLKLFTIKEAFLTKEKLTRDTKLYEDLGITGDDAIEFILAYSKYFQVDVVNFMAADYFEDEGRSTLFRKGTNKKIITLGDLEKGIIAGKLNEEIIGK
jgi:hypothetical protein